MNLKGGTCLLLLIMASAVSAKPSAETGKNKPDYQNMMKQMMMSCHEKGYATPQRTLLKTIFSNSTKLVVQDGDQAETPLSSFLQVLDSATKGRSRTETSLLPVDVSNKMANKKLTCRSLLGIIERMKGSAGASDCYLKAYVAPLSWEASMSQCEGADLKDYKSLLWAAKPLLEMRSFAILNLPPKVDIQKLTAIMETLQKVYNSISNNERSFVAKWSREQIAQNMFNCTMKPPRSHQSSRPMKQCKTPLQGLGLEELSISGNFMSRLPPEDVESGSAKKLCEFFNTTKFTSMESFKYPTVCNKHLQQYRQCLSKKEFAERLDKLGPLKCCLKDVPTIKPDVARRLLPQLSNCSSSKTENLKRRLVRLVTSNSSSSLALKDVGKNAMFLLVQKYLDLPLKILKEFLKKLTHQWKPAQQCMLVKKSLGPQCEKLSFKELKDALSLTKAVPACLIKHLTSDEVLQYVETLKDMSGYLKKRQIKAMLKKLPLSFLKTKMPGSLACSVSLRSLRKANFTEWNQVENKTWCRPQAAFLVKKLLKQKQIKFGLLRWIIQGFTCQMIEESDDELLARAMKEVPQWLSKNQARCAAMKLFRTLEEKRDDYFKTITEAELNDIPNDALTHLPPSKVKELPDAVCPVFLMKMEKANLTLLPRRAWTRPALVEKALRCLANGTDLSRLTMLDMSRLGQLVCELPAVKLRLLDAEVRNFTLEQMASCEHIPRRHRQGLIQLLRETFGDFPEWNAETMENVGALLLLDDNATSALPKKPWMKDVLNFLKPRMSRSSEALKRIWFDSASNSSSNATDNDNGASSGKSVAGGPTEEQIMEVGPAASCFWSVEQLRKISNDTFSTTVDTLGECPSFSAEQLKVLTEKAIELFGPVSKMSDCQVIQLRCVSRGFSDSQLEQLPFSLDSLEELQHCSWTEKQMAAVWRGIAKRGNLTAKKLGAEEMVSLNSFMCGLDVSEIQQLNLEEFDEAVGSMAALKCSSEKLQQFKQLAVSSAGESSTWDQAQTSEKSSIISGFNSAELSSLDPDVFSFISKSSIPLISPISFSALSVKQLRSFGPENAAMVTDAQLDALNKEQQTAVEEAATGAYRQLKTSVVPASYSGAPSLSVEGMSAFMKPVLFLCMGFMLL